MKTAPDVRSNVRFVPLYRPSGVIYCVTLTWKCWTPSLNQITNLWWWAPSPAASATHGANCDWARNCVITAPEQCPSFGGEWPPRRPAWLRGQSEEKKLSDATQQPLSVVDQAAIEG